MNFYKHYKQGFHPFKTKLWLCLLFGISHRFVFCQIMVINGVLLNSANNTAISFATIANNTTGKFTLSDSAGRFSIPFLMGDSLIISHIAYQRMAIKTDSSQHIFYLSQKKILLQEVVIGAKTLTREEHLGYDLSKGTDRLDLQKNYRLAVYIQNNHGVDGFIKSIHFNIDEIRKCHNGIRILIFEVDTTDIKKSIVLLCKPIELIFNKIRHKNKVDVSDFSIPFPPGGAIVSIESFGWKEDCAPEDMMTLKCTRNITETVTLVGYGNNKWELMKYPTWKYTPQIGITAGFKQ